jgi:hypothetical protein
MKLYKVEIEKNDDSKNAAHWGTQYYFVIASSFGNAEDKAKKFEKSHGIMKNIVFMGDVTERDKDVIILKDRF